MTKKKNNVTVKKEQIKKEEKENKKNLFKKIDPEILKLIKTVLGVAAAVLLVYLLTILMRAMGVFDKGYTKLETPESQISYTEILVSSVFNRSEEEYYVVFSDFSDNEDIYLDTVLNVYESKSKLKVYRVDMSNMINDDYKSEKGNTKASKVEDLKINGSTLIKVKNGKNVLYIEGTNNIETELNK